MEKLPCDSTQVRWQLLSGFYELSVKQRRIDLIVEGAELKRREATSKPPVQPPTRGYARLYAQEILGADQGCDFAFLKPP